MGGGGGGRCPHGRGFTNKQAEARKLESVMDPTRREPLYPLRQMQGTPLDATHHSHFSLAFSSLRLFCLHFLPTFLTASPKPQNQRRLLHHTSQPFVKSATYTSSSPSPSVPNGGFFYRWSKLLFESRLYAHHMSPKTSRKGRGTTFDFTYMKIQVA